MTLYKIDKAILEAIDFDTGEIIDPEKLDALQMERSTKIENIALYVKNLLADADAIKAEKDALAARESAKRKKAENLKGYLAYALAGEKFDTAKCAVSFIKSEKVEVEDMAHIPAGLLRVKNSVEPNKKAIKAAIKAGHEIKGCRLVESISTQIK